jgi:hypothetical protein
MSEHVEIQDWELTNVGVRMRCPACDIPAYLVHDVAEDGEVDPSVDCRLCSFHEHVVLEDWNHGPIVFEDEEE